MKVRGLLLLFAVIACGPTVGDPCTLPKDCLGKLCLSVGLPDGYCSTSCVIENPNACPAGSLCIADGASVGTNACFRLCATERDCRAGYLCQQARGSQAAVCVGPGGL